MDQFKKIGNPPKVPVKQTVTVVATTNTTDTADDGMNAEDETAPDEEQERLREEQDLAGQCQCEEDDQD